MDNKTAWQTIRAFAEGRTRHLDRRDCPDANTGHGSRDPECHVCQALDTLTGAQCLAQIEEPAQPVAPVLDDRWKARMLDGRAIERDEMGLGDHPELPQLDEGMKPRGFFAALGLELTHTMAEDQLDWEVLGVMSDAVNWTDWQPTAPQGDGWKLVAIFDTEDGPAAWWLRELAEAEDSTTTIRNLQAEVEKLNARIARAGAAPAAVALEHPPMPDTWAVVASIEGQDVVCISSSALSGKGELTESEEQAVIGMAQHLLAFVGYGLPPCDFDPDDEPAAAPALEAPAAHAGWKLVPVEPTREMLDAYLEMKGLFHSARSDWAAMLAAAPQAPAAPSAVATQVIENLLQLARIVNTAVEDWGESFEDGSSEVTFHKEEADKLEEILEFFDSLPDAPPEEGVILSGPSRAARVLRAMAAPAAPVVDAGGQVLGEWPRVSGVGRDAESPRTLLLYLQTEASDDELRAIHDALLDGGALATHALSELMHIGYRVEGGKLVPPENLSVRASEFFGVTAVAAKATAVHSDDVAVDRFAVEMKAKLAAARAKGRGGWETCPPEVLSRMLREHADKGDPRDVANFCMFLWSLGQPISVAAPAAPAVDAQGERDAAFEAVRNRLCSLQRYSFVLDDDGIVRRAHDRTGSWIEFDDAHALFDPVAVDAAIAAQAKEGGAPVADAAPLDVCTDPYNCARCKTHPAHRGDMHHAGISRIGGSA